ncbi:MAG: hypothetical protein K5930_09755 [Treponemataceae bacterium]|nr:hypothetical protein [Treponemataceae bacterium]
MKEFYIPILDMNLEKNTDQKMNDREVPGIELEYPWEGYKPRKLFTGVFVAAGKDGFALSFCAEVPGGKLVSRRTEDKSKVFEDDCLELFISPEDSIYYAWEINPNGACLDYRVFTGDRAQASENSKKYDGGEKIYGSLTDTVAGLPLLFDYDWKSNAVRRIEIEDGFWYMELFIPWGDMGLSQAPEAGRTWYGTVNRVDAGARSRAVAGEKRSENCGFSCLIEDTDLVSFHQPKKFAAFHFEAADTKH